MKCVNKPSINNKLMSWRRKFMLQLQVNSRQFNICNGFICQIWNSHMFSCPDVKMPFCFSVIYSIVAIAFKTINNTRAEFYGKSVFKVRLSLSKKNCVICLIESPLNIMKNVFCFIWKALFALKIFKFLSQSFGHVGKTVWLER